MTHTNFSKWKLNPRSYPRVSDVKIHRVHSPATVEAPLTAPFNMFGLKLPNCLHRPKFRAFMWISMESKQVLVEKTSRKHGVIILIATVMFQTTHNHDMRLHRCEGSLLLSVDAQKLLQGKPVHYHGTSQQVRAASQVRITQWPGETLVTAYQVTVTCNNSTPD